VITSKLTSKAQTTIPQPIRAALKLQEGNKLVYEIRGQQVVLMKALQASHADDPFRTFGATRPMLPSASSEQPPSYKLDLFALSHGSLLQNVEKRAGMSL
jgi:antitoxin PrlF